MSDSSHQNIHKSSSAEKLDWNKEVFELQKDLTPDAKYGALSESLRQKVPAEKVCSMFCGGSACKYCNPASPKSPWKDSDMEIKGLYSNWITENVLAMSRPTTKAIKDFDLITQFKKAGIRSVINLQQPGEHSSCGFGNESEGFSYKPSDFMEQEIFFYNFGWKDYGVGSLENIMDMVKVMQFAVSQGKVAVHCHAGLGRTGVLIATYLLYTNRESPNHVIHYIRSKRRGSIQTRSQIDCIREFAEYLKPLRIIFSTLSTNDDEPSQSSVDQTDFTLRQFIIRQQAYLHGQEAKRLKYIPKIIYVCCQRLLELADRGSHHEFHDSYQDVRAEAPKAFLNSPVSSDPASPASVTSAQGTSLTIPSLTVGSGRQSTRDSFTAVSMTRHSMSRLKKSLSSTSLNSGVVELLQEDSRAALRHARTNDDLQAAQRVAKAMACWQYTPQQQHQIDSYKMKLNSENWAYNALYDERDATVIAGLVWEWLDTLREPILHPQDMPALLAHDDVSRALHVLNKASRGVVEVLFFTVARLLPLEARQQDELFCRLLSTLTHQNMLLGLEYLQAGVTSDSAAATTMSLTVTRTSNASGIMRSHLADKLMSFFAALTRHFHRMVHEGSLRRSLRASALSQDKQTSLQIDVNTSSNNSGTTLGAVNGSRQRLSPLIADAQKQDIVIQQSRDDPYSSPKHDVTRVIHKQSKHEYERSVPPALNGDSLPSTDDNSSGYSNDSSDVNSTTENRTPNDSLTKQPVFTL